MKTEKMSKIIKASLKYVEKHLSGFDEFTVNIMSFPINNDCVEEPSYATIVWDINQIYFVFFDGVFAYKIPYPSQIFFEDMSKCFIEKAERSIKYLKNE